MKNIFKKNQIIITALAIMIAVAGYLNFIGDDENAKETVSGGTNDMEEALDVSLEDGNAAESDWNNDMVLNEMLSQSTDENGEIQSLDSDETTETSAEASQDTENAQEDMQDTDSPSEKEIGEAALVSGSTGVDAISAAKLSREQIRSKNKETLMDIIENSSVSETQKSKAVEAMVEMTEIAEKELDAETLLSTKGFTEAVVSISDGMADVVINEESLSDAQRAQIEDIVKRKTGIEAKNIVITPIAK